MEIKIPSGEAQQRCPSTVSLFCPARSRRTNDDRSLSRSVRPSAINGEFPVFSLKTGLSSEAKRGEGCLSFQNMLIQWRKKEAKNTKAKSIFHFLRILRTFCFFIFSGFLNFLIWKWNVINFRNCSASSRRRTRSWRPIWRTPSSSWRTSRPSSCRRRKRRRRVLA